MNPARTSSSIDWPPVPVWWKTRTSYPSSSSCSRAAVTHGVVTPNIDAPISGRASPGSGMDAEAMPAIAAAALPMILAEIWLTPAMSTTEYIIAMSTAPTYGRVSPDPTVDTISFGTPTGSRCIACVTSDVPPVPPMPTTPSSRPSRCSRSTMAAAPRDMVSTAAPRSPAAASSSTSAPAARATSRRGTSARSPAPPAHRHRRGARRPRARSAGRAGRRTPLPSCPACRSQRRFPRLLLRSVAGNDNCPARR